MFNDDSVTVSLDNRLIRTKEGKVFSPNVFGTSFWQRYLLQYSKVIIVARLVDVSECFDLNGYSEISDPRIIVHGVTYFHGPKDLFLKIHRVLQDLFWIARSENYVKKSHFILRMPSLVSSLLFIILYLKRTKFAVEVVGNVYEAVKQTNKKWYSKFVALVLQLLMKKCVKEASFACYVTVQSLQRTYPTKGISYSCSSIEMYDDNYIEQNEIERKLDHFYTSLAQKSMTISHIGTMDAKYKNQDQLILAVYHLYRAGWDVKLHLIGDGCYRSYFEEVCVKEKVSHLVKFHGRVNRTIVNSILDETDIFILPSSTEGFPRVNVEAAARGCLILATDVGGVSEFVPQSCLLKDIRAETIFMAITEMLKMPEVYRDVIKFNYEKSFSFHCNNLNKVRKAFYGDFWSSFK